MGTSTVLDGLNGHICEGFDAVPWVGWLDGGSPCGHPPYGGLSYMPDYRRYRVPGGTYFFTVNLLERRLDTLVLHIEVLREAVRVTRLERPFQIDAWVVLHDHLHCLWTLPPGDDDFSNR